MAPNAVKNSIRAYKVIGREGALSSACWLRMVVGLHCREDWSMNGTSDGTEIKHINTWEY
jgi:hypothetical protein